MKDINLLLTDIEEEIRKRKIPVVYLEQFKNLLSLKEKKDILILLRKYNITEDQYNRNLRNLKNLFPDREKGINYLKSLYEEYKKSLNQEKVEDVSYYLNIAKKVLETGCSIEEYCAATGEYRLYELREVLTKIKFSYRQVHYQLEELSYENKRKFASYISSIVFEMKESDYFDIFDYYCLTKLHPYDFARICSEVIPNMGDREMIKVKILLKKLIEKANLKISKEAELNGRTIISGREVTREEKENIFNLLEQLNIPNTAYKISLKRYINNDEKILEYMGIKKVK